MGQNTGRLNERIVHSHLLNIRHELSLGTVAKAEKDHLLVFILTLHFKVPYGLAVRIPGFHPGGPGSTPGMGTTLFVPYMPWVIPFLYKILVGGKNKQTNKK